MEICEVIYKCPDDTSPVVMNNFVNDEHKYIIRKDLVEKNDTKENNEARVISIDTENK